MKKFVVYPLLVLLATFFSACGIGTALVANHNQNATEVHLGANNFKVIDQVSGSSETSYVLGIGGTKQKQLYQNAYSAMINKAKLLNGPKAIINVMTEEHISGFAPFYVKRTLTVSAQVVEFTK